MPMPKPKSNCWTLIIAVCKRHRQWRTDKRQNADANTVISYKLGKGTQWLRVRLSIAIAFCCIKAQAKLLSSPTAVAAVTLRLSRPFFVLVLGNGGNGEPEFG